MTGDKWKQHKPGERRERRDGEGEADETLTRQLCVRKEQTF